jgi:hypothetical protein
MSTIVRSLQAKYGVDSSMGKPLRYILRSMKRALVLLVFGSLLTACLVGVISSGSAVAFAQVGVNSVVPAPEIGAFLPADYRVTSVVKMDLDGASAYQEAVTAVGTTGALGYVPTTVVLIAWDSFADRWESVFNAASQESYQTQTMTGQKGPGLICTCGTGPVAAVMHDLPGHMASLVYWVPAVAGNTTVWLIGVVNFRDQLADLVWSDQLNVAHIESYGVKPPNPYASPAVVGRSPHQELLVTAPWETADDDQSYAVRQYSFTVKAEERGPGEWDYEAVNDTRSLVGVEVSTSATLSGAAKVAYVYPGSPAQGRLRVGDLIEAVAGAKAPPEARALGGAEVIDQVALFYPDQTIRLVVDRAGQFLNIPITLGRWSPAIQEYVEVGQSLTHILVSM